MNSSLKSFVPGMGRILGMTPSALYERQRVLVREGILQAEGNRGPGSGVRSTAGSIAYLMIAALVSENLNTTAQQVRLIARTKPDVSECILTRQRSFIDALQVILLSAAASNAIEEISISKNVQRAVLIFRWQKTVGKTVFTSHDIQKSDLPIIRNDAVIGRKTIVELGNDVRAVVEDNIYSGEVE